MDAPVIVGIDIGTTKVCTLVAREETPDQMRVLGVGIEPSLGIRKGTVVDMAAASQSIALAFFNAARFSSSSAARVRMQAEMRFGAVSASSRAALRAFLAIVSMVF